MKYLVIVLGATLFIACGEKRKNHHDNERFSEREFHMDGKRDSIHELRKKKKLDKLTKKLDLTTTQLEEIKKLDEKYESQLEVLREEMFKSREKHRSLIEGKMEDMKKILTADQVGKLEEMKARFKHKHPMKPHEE